MNTITQIHPDPPERLITLKDRIFSCGSCFATNIGVSLAKQGIEVTTNPYGTLYNPVSILQMCNDLLSVRKYSQEDLNVDRGLYFSLNHATAFDTSDPALVLGHINRTIENSGKELRKSSVIIITPGTAVVYEYKGKIVANCHHLPAAQFTERLLELQELVESFLGIIKVLRDNLDNPLIIFTVSPVRHYPQRLRLNTLSKSLLHIALEQVCRKTGAYYYPVYEQVIDELREYRYYKEDGIHLSDDAVSLIMDRFTKSLFAKEALGYMQQISKMEQLLAHRVKNPHTDATKKMLLDTLSGIIRLEKARKGNCLHEMKTEVVFRLMLYFELTDQDLALLENETDLSLYKALSAFLKGEKTEGGDFSMADVHNPRLIELLKDKLFADFCKKGIYTQNR